MPKTTPQRIMVGMSGGVDSSVTALLLKQQGFDVEGLFMKNWEEEDTETFCSAAEDLRDAESVCEQLGIPLHTVNFSAEYWERVFAYFIEEYRAGRTPNPDVLCNTEIKFKAFLEHAVSLGAHKIATGHYAQVRHRGYELQLLRATDTGKDQTYFLYALAQAQLAKSVFPIGSLEKQTVRRIAASHHLAVHAKKDSTGICFIGERKFRDFLGRYLPAQPGEIRTPTGQLLGTHEGLMFYTIGQRQGLGIGGRRGSGGDPWYVAAKDVDNNILIVVQGHDHPSLYRDSLEATSPSWIVGTPPHLPLRCRAKIRYRQAEQACTVAAGDEGRLRVLFDQPQRAVSPGQSVVFYQGDVCLGGGTIDGTVEHE